MDAREQVTKDMNVLEAERTVAIGLTILENSHLTELLLNHKSDDPKEQIPEDNLDMRMAQLGWRIGWFAAIIGSSIIEGVNGYMGALAKYAESKASKRIITS